MTTTIRYNANFIVLTETGATLWLGLMRRCMWNESIGTVHGGTQTLTNLKSYLSSLFPELACLCIIRESTM